MHLLLLVAALCARASTALTHSVLEYGADPTGEASSTRAVHAALVDIAARGYGTLLFPPGSYKLAPFNLSSNSVLLLDNARLLAEGMSAFKLVPPLPSYGMGRDKLPNDLAGRFQPFIGVYYADNVTITTNSSGYIHGGGEPWWAAKSGGYLNNTPPHLIEVGWSQNVDVGAPPGSPKNALTFVNSPFWFVHLYDSQDLIFHDTSVFADPLEGNTDAVDPDSSRNVLIERILYVGGDDGVAIKSGWDDAGIRYGKPSVNITVRDSDFTTRACCVCVGSEMSGGAEHISVSNVRCTNVGDAFYVKSVRFPVAASGWQPPPPPARARCFVPPHARLLARPPAHDADPRPRRLRARL